MLRRGEFANSTIAVFHGVDFLRGDHSLLVCVVSSRERLETEKYGRVT